MNGHHVVFGKVLEGMDVVHKIERSETDDRDKPVANCVIVKSGLIFVDSPFTVSKEGVEEE